MILLYVVVIVCVCFRVKGFGGSNTDWVIFGFLIKENFGSLLVVGVNLLGKILLLVVVVVFESG